MKTVEVAIEPLTPVNFKPFGTIVGADAGPPALRWDTLTTWKTPFEVDGEMQMTLCRYQREPVRWHKMERHLAVTQAFLPLAGVQSIMVVAPLTDPSNRLAAPPPATMRAFRMDGTQGVILARGTWHALRRFPLEAPYIDIVLLTGRDTQAELEKQAKDGSLPALTHEVDYQVLFEVNFRIAGMD
jgi:ureidoglycolate hydrolase